MDRQTSARKSAQCTTDAAVATHIFCDHRTHSISRQAAVSTTFDDIWRALCCHCTAPKSSLVDTGSEEATLSEASDGGNLLQKMACQSVCVYLLGFLPTVANFESVPFCAHTEKERSTDCPRSTSKPQHGHCSRQTEMERKRTLSSFFFSFTSRHDQVEGQIVTNQGKFEAGKK